MSSLDAEFYKELAERMRLVNRFNSSKPVVPVETKTRDTAAIEGLTFDDVNTDTAKNVGEAGVEAKSLHQLWVENGCKFPFTAVKAMSDLGVVPLGISVKFLEHCPQHPGCFLCDYPPGVPYAGLSLWTTPKVWKAA